MNGQIRALEIRLLGEDGHQYGVVKIEDARKIAEEKILDLVEVSPTAKPPVVKLIDYGKFKYQIQKKASEAKKKQVVIQIKEVQFRPNIDQHDLDVKLKKIEKFLEHGDKIKLIMQFRGREIAYKQAGLDKFNSIMQTVMDLGGAIEAEPKLMGSRIIAMVAASKKK